MRAAFELDAVAPAVASKALAATGVADLDAEPLVAVAAFDATADFATAFFVVEVFFFVTVAFGFSVFEAVVVTPEADTDNSPNVRAEAAADRRRREVECFIAYRGAESRRAIVGYTPI